MKYLATTSFGEEFTVEEGQGTAVLETIGENNYKVVLEVNGFKYPVYGYLGAASADLVDYLSSKSGEVVNYRIEVRRRKGVNSSIPFAELDGKSQTRRLFAKADDVWSVEALKDSASHSESTQLTVSDGDLLARLLDARRSELPEAVIHQVAAACVIQGIPGSKVLTVLTQQAESRLTVSTESTASAEPAPEVETELKPQDAVAADPEVDLVSVENVRSLARLANLAGVDNDTVSVWLNAKYGVQHVTSLPDSEVVDMLTHYRSLGAKGGPEAFATDVGGVIAA